MTAVDRPEGALGLAEAIPVDYGSLTAGLPRAGRKQNLVHQAWGMARPSRCRVGIAQH